jgi:hypothetical protein
MTDLKLIGKGMFSVCYRESENTVLIASEDPVKECMGTGWFPDSPLFPKVERVACGLYRMPYYAKVSSLKSALDPDQWVIYQALRAMVKASVFSGRNPDFRIDFVRKQIDTLQDETLRETLSEAVDALANYGADIGFEISPRNVAVSDGKLILLDCFYFTTKVHAVSTGRDRMRPMTKRQILAALNGN